MAISTDHSLPSTASPLKHVTLWVFIALGVLALFFLIAFDHVRAAVAFTAVSAIVALATIRLRLALAATLVFLVFLGDLRRLLIPVADWSATDPLLLVGPILALALAGNALMTGALSFDSSPSRWMLALMAIMILQVFNPHQGGLIVGVAGIMFQLIPLLWFWIGKAYATRSFLRTLLFRVVLTLTVLATLFGLYQSLVGYLPYQLEWFRIAGYSSLGNPERGLSPITFFASNTEHAIFVSLGIVLLWSMVLCKRWKAILLIPILFGALLMTGIRGPVAKILAVAAGLWAILGRNVTAWIARGGLALTVAAAGLFWSLSGISQTLDNAPSGVQSRLERQADEFVRTPTGQREYSSAGTHLGMMIHGYRRGLQYPLGMGLGAGTKAAMKFGEAGSSEVDLADSVRSLGIPGGIVYHVLVVLLVIQGFRLWNRERSLLSMALLGFMGITFLGWLSGGRYAVTPLLWFCLGAADRFYQSSPDDSE